MGLDMFLTKRVVAVAGACYWRKANHIHGWFVDNVQGGKDDCEEYPVTHAQLKKLLGLAKVVKDNPVMAKALLPVRSGALFGSYEYDDYYFKNIDLTIEQLEKILATPLEDGEQLIYQSSW